MLTSKMICHMLRHLAGLSTEHLWVIYGLFPFSQSR
ncbi:hypothetical protein LOK49_LG10G00655 [Camellia lanceoleosa]|uniref:Uncharacterized protein n=1 Tax=Camellia lanceoleosa TaxID=1840588 RepID=A0ACC0GB27_9ERIC|nr:hypothetical protein LOK49_LG10G00655 [Camellia lanceoleosa]